MKKEKDTYTKCFVCKRSYYRTDKYCRDCGRKLSVVRFVEVVDKAKKATKAKKDVWFPNVKLL